MGPHRLERRPGKAGPRVPKAFDGRSRRDMTDRPALPRLAPEAAVGAAVTYIIKRRIGSDARANRGELCAPLEIDAAPRRNDRVRQAGMIGDAGNMPPMARARQYDGAAFAFGQIGRAHV